MMRVINAPLLVVLVATGAGCDSKVTTSDPSAATRAEQRSREHETCGSSLDCEDGLRCFAHVCRRTQRSNVGDYFSAVGASARARGEHQAAIAAYKAALGHYDAEKIPLPADVDCAYGGALAAARSSKEEADLGARVLHRCVLEVPVGSALRGQALADLATLADAGLDPLLVGAAKTADVYLTKGPARPATDKLVVSVTAAPPPAKSQPLIEAKLAEPDVKKALIACWEQYNAETKKPALAVTIGVKVAYLPSEFEDEPGRFSVKVDPPVPLPPGPVAAADTCVRQVVEPAVAALKISERFTTKLTIEVK